MFDKIKKFFSSIVGSNPSNGKETSTPTPSKKEKSSSSVVVYALFAADDLPAGEEKTGFASSAPTPPAKPPITFGSSKEQLYLAIDRILFFRHYDHYRSWCSLHDKKSVGFDSESWHDYAQKIIDPNDTSNHFTILEQHMDADDIATVMRLYTVCRPLFLNHEMAQIECFNYIGHEPQEAQRYFKDISGIETEIDKLCDEVLVEYEKSVQETMRTDINKNKYDA